MDRAPEPSPAAELLPAPTWVEVVLVGLDDRPIAGERCVITPPDGQARTGVTDAAGRVRIAGLLAPGECAISFPDLDGDAWGPA